jgi:hypothetical protein
MRWVAAADAEGVRPSPKVSRQHHCGEEERMFHHVIVGITGLVSWIEENKTREDILYQYICPFIRREVTIHDDQLFNMSSFGSLLVYRTDRPVDSDWPVKKSDLTDKDGALKHYEYEKALRQAFSEIATDVTKELYREALILLETGEYKETQSKLIDAEKGRYSFFICPFGNEEVDHNYEYVIKPTVKQYQFEIERADEISHTRTITDIILAAINRARFVVADLTAERPNCYYELGYAHALRKPVIVLAKQDTTRHFDISTYKWNYWNDYQDLKPQFEKEVAAVVRELGIHR